MPGSVSKVEMDCDCCHTGSHFIVSPRKEWSMTFIAVRCPHCQSDQIVKRGKTARGTQRYLCQNTLCVRGSFLNALEDYRKGDYGDCLTKCTSAFESALKITSD